MENTPSTCYVTTVQDRCRVCFACVRECPAKAIRIEGGQAQLVPERCIACGNCVQVCSQGAKVVVSTIDKVEAILKTAARVSICLAPSFPAEFQEDYDFRVLVGMVRALGFNYVNEVAFGADLVAERYRRLYATGKGKQYIATSCPAAVGYVERYHPEMVDKLAPIVSPMIATARALRYLHGADLKVVFVGPCIGKKVEAEDELVRGEINGTLTFVELRKMLEARGIDQDNTEPSDFDPPHPGLGGLFSLNRGFLQAAGIHEDLVTNDIVGAYGKSRFTVALDEIARGNMDATILEILFCNGCIMGPGFSSTESPFQRRARISFYVKYRLAELDKEEWHRVMARFSGLDLKRSFGAKHQKLEHPSEADVEGILRRTGKFKFEDELNCGACGYQTCREHAAAIHAGLAESEMCLPFTISELQKTVNELSFANERLQSTQEQLMHSERLASMGQLAAGVAHELNNPLGIVLMYSHLLKDELQSDSGLFKDLSLIADQADRCKRIVANLLDFARQNRVLLQSVEVNEFVQKALTSVPMPPSIEVKVVASHSHETCEMDPEQMTQVFTNLVSNACAAMENGGQLTIETRDDEEHFILSVMDSGCGITEQNLSKVFQPFFTTKQIGKGTGLGLAVAYGIVKMHRGAITVESNADPKTSATGTKFTVTIPRSARPERVE